MPSGHVASPALRMEWEESEWPVWPWRWLTAAATSRQSGSEWVGPLGRGSVETLDDCFGGRKQPLSVTPGPRLPVPDPTVRASGTALWGAPLQPRFTLMPKSAQCCVLAGWEDGDLASNGSTCEHSLTLKTSCESATSWRSNYLHLQHQPPHENKKKRRSSVSRAQQVI